jgi:hypothetical protein
MTDQIVIKSILILAFIFFGFVLLRPGKGARNQALRMLGLLVFIGIVVYAILFPTVINDIAEFVGVGRGTDLLLYAFVIVFIAQALSSARRRKAQSAEITVLARKIALMEPKYSSLKD